MGSLLCSRRVVPGEMLTFLKECLVAGCVRGNFWLSRYYVEVLEVCALSSFPLPVWASLFVALFFPLSPPHRAAL